MRFVCFSNSKTSNVAAIKHPTSDVGQTSNSDHLSLAKQALHELLSRSHPPASSIQNIPTYAHDDTQSALLFLPLIEDCVDTFTAAMGGKSESAFSSPAMSLVTNVSDSSVESSGGSLRSLSMAPPADRHTNTVLNALGVLNTLVNCSAHVRHAIVCHVTPLSTSTQKGKVGGAKIVFFNFYKYNVPEYTHVGFLFHFGFLLAETKHLNCQSN